MKKKAVLVVLALSTALFMFGCGKSEKEEAKEYYQEELGLTEEEAQEVADFVYSDGSDPEEGQAQEEEVTSDKELEHFPVSEEWKNYSVADSMIQIDDTMYTAGVTVSEIMKKVEGSAAGYTYEYNPGKLVNKDKAETIEIYRGNDKWFTISVYNFFRGTWTLEELPVQVIEIQKPAQEYCYYIDGRDYDDIVSMKYNDVKALYDTVFSDDNFDDGIRINMKFEDRSEDYIEETIQKRKEDMHYLDSRYNVTYGEWDVPRIKDGLGFAYNTPTLIKPELVYIDPDGDIDKYGYMGVSSSYTFFIDKNTSEILEFEVRIASSRKDYSKEPVIIE